MELTHIAVRILFAYVFLLGITRIAGKHFVAEASPRDFVLAVVLGDVIDDLLWGEVGAEKFAIAAATLVLVELLVTLVSLANNRFDRLVNGQPVLLLEDGRPVLGGMRHERMHEKDVASLLRHKGYERDRWSEVRQGWLETNGELSARPYDEYEPAQSEDRRNVRARVKR